MTDPVAPRTAVPTDELATIGRRVVARLVDGVVLLVPVMLLIAPSVDITSEDEVSIPLWVQVAVAAVIGVYEIAMTAWRGQTVGKIATRIKVVRADEGSPPTVTQAAIRYLLPGAAGSIPVVGFFLALAIYLVAVRDPQRRGLHDRAAGTLVVQAK